MSTERRLAVILCLISLSLLAYSVSTCFLSYPGLDIGLNGIVVSNCGAYPSQTSGLFNASLIAVGFLNSILALHILRLGAIPVRSRAGFFLLLGAAALALLGVFSLPVDNDMFSTPRIVHWTIATIYFLAEAFAIAGVARHIKASQPKLYKWSWVANIAVIVLTLGSVLLVSKVLSEAIHFTLVLIWKLSISLRIGQIPFKQFEG